MPSAVKVIVEGREDSQQEISKVSAACRWLWCHFPTANTPWKLPQADVSTGKADSISCSSYLYWRCSTQSRKPTVCRFCCYLIHWTQMFVVYWI